MYIQRRRLTYSTGNCLFHALSDQLYGEQSHHARLRADTVDYMRQHPDDFKAFIVVNQGGGFRRNPKRKNAGALKDTFDLTPPTQAEIDKAYAMSLDNMAKGGTYGEHLESVAFAANFHVNVRIWATGCGAFVHIDCPNTLPGENIPTLYIAHHVSYRVKSETENKLKNPGLRTLLFHSQSQWSIHWTPRNRHKSRLS